MEPCAAAEPDGLATICELALGRFTFVLRLNFGRGCRFDLLTLFSALPEDRVGVQLARAVWTCWAFGSPRRLREEVCASTVDAVSALIENAANKATLSGRGI